MYRPWWQRWQYLVPLGALAATAAFALIVVSSSAKHAPERTSRLTAPRDAGTSEPVEAPAREHAPALWLDGEPFDLDEVEPSALDEVAPDPALESSDDIEDDAVTDPAGDDGILPVVDYGWLETLDDAAVARAESWLARKRS